jgi:hypothetical protein
MTSGDGVVAWRWRLSFDNRMTGSSADSALFSAAVRALPVTAQKVTASFSVR